MGSPLVLASKLDLAAASTLMSTLREHEDDPEVILDLSEVKHFGALCMQVILAAAKHATSQDRKISMTNVSDRVIDQMRVMGMTPEAITRGPQ
jgi:chemotaxis protein CheX